MTVAFRVDIAGQTVPLRFQTVGFAGIREIVEADLLVDINARAAKAANLSDLADNNTARGNLIVTRQISVESYLDPARVPGVTDDAPAFTAAIADALSTGARSVAVPRLATDYYFATGVQIKPGEARFEIVGLGSPTIQALSRLNGYVFSFDQEEGGGDYPQNIWWKGINLRSGAEPDIGTSMLDGNSFIGLRFGLLSSYLRIEDSRFAGFSGAGIQFNQVVNVRCINVDLHNCLRGREWVKNPDTNNPCAAVTVWDGYVTGCRSGDYAENGLTAFTFSNNVIYEYCGSSTEADEEAGIRIKGGIGTINISYRETNFRNTWLTDVLVPQLGANFGSGSTFADVEAWAGVSGGDRGYAKLDNRTLTITEIAPDPTTNANGLTILGNIGINTPAISGVQGHYSGSEARFRLTATNPSGQSFELVSGGGGILGTGNCGIYDVTAGSMRLEIGTGTGKLAVTGSGASMEAALNGTRILKTQRAAVADATDAASTITQLNALLSRLRDHGLIAT